MHDWEKIRVLAREGVPKARIAAELGNSLRWIGRCCHALETLRFGDALGQGWQVSWHLGTGSGSDENVHFSPGLWGAREAR